MPLWKFLAQVLTTSDLEVAILRCERDQSSVERFSSGSIAISATYSLRFSIRSSRVRAAISPIFCSGCRTVVHCEATAYLTAERLKLFYVLRQAQEYRRGHPDVAPDDVVESILSGMGCVGKLPGKPSTVAEMEESVAPVLPELKDWRSVPGSYFEPFGSAHWTNAVTCQSNQFRDKYMVSHLTTAVEHGERVFAVVESMRIGF
jgi:hypothetical protein